MYVSIMILASINGIAIKGREIEKIRKVSTDQICDGYYKCKIAVEVNVSQSV